MADDHDHFMGLAIELSKKAMAAGNVPVGAVLVRGGAVIGEGYNQARSALDPTSHGETEAVRDACRKLGTGDLSGATCYTAMEPCPMCCWVLLDTGVSRLVLGARHAGMRRTEYGTYSVEALLAMLGREMEIVTGVRVAECEAVRRAWPEWKEPAT